MELFIRIVNGQPFEHPILGDNFREAFPNVDTNNLPPEFARFERIPCPQIAGTYELDVVSYQWVDGVVKDVWTMRAMTQEEQDAKIADVKTRQPFPSWTFDEPTCRFVPPTPYPTDGKYYLWDEPTLSWIEVT